MARMDDTQVLKLEDLFHIRSLEDTKPLNETKRIWVGGDMVSPYEPITL